MIAHSLSEAALVGGCGSVVLEGEISLSFGALTGAFLSRLRFVGSGTSESSLPVTAFAPLLCVGTFEGSAA